MTDPVFVNALRTVMKVGSAAFQKAASAELSRQIAKLTRRPRARRSAPPASKPRAGAVPAPAATGAKRSATELGATSDAVLEIIRGQPGIIPEGIAKKLGLVSRDIALPLEMLRRGRSGAAEVTWTGRKRYTRYTAVS